MSDVALGSLFRFIRNGMNVKQDKSGVGLPITRIETISDAVIDPTRVGFAGLEDRHARDWLLEPGDILFSHINSVQHIGKCAIYRGQPEKLVHGMNLLCLRSDETKLLPEFAKYLLRSTQFRARLSNCIKKAVNQASVSIGDIQAIPVTVPPLPEQRRIAEILDKADALRAKRRAALAQLDTLTQSIFLDMFGDPATNPEGCISKSLTSVCRCYSGGTPSKGQSGYWAGRVPWFSPKDLKQDDLFDSQDHVNEAVPSETNLKLLPPNTVAIVVRGMILAHTFPVSVIRVAATINQDLKALLPNNGVELDPQFLAHCLRVQSRAILASVSESAHGTKRLDAEALAKIAVPLPSGESQREFSRRVARAEQCKAGQRTSLRELDLLLASLQQRAFRGDL